jgi:tetratricopeptide (TPR) repeat protein
VTESEEALPAGARVAIALFSLFLFRWAIYGPVSMTTSKEQNTQTQLRTLIAGSQAAVRDCKYEEALAPLEALTKLQPKNHVYWWQCAQVAGALRRPPQEVHYLEEFVKVAPIPGEACPRLAFLYEQMGEKSHALDAFARCAEYSPNDLQDQFYYGHALEQAAEIDKALSIYENALKRGTNGDVESGYGRMLLRKGKPSQALLAVEPTLKRNPNNVDALLVAGIALSRQGKLEPARTLLERGVRLHDDSDFQYALGAIAESQGRSTDAIRHYDASIALDPKNQDARNRRMRFAPAKTP